MNIRIVPVSDVYVLDTSVAVELRDSNRSVLERVEALGEQVAISIVTRIELENGLVTDPSQAAIRRDRLQRLLQAMRVLPLEDPAADAYARIVTAVGFSRRKLLDRMIAANAIAVGATLVTLNSSDFADIPELRLEAWERA